MKDEEGGAAERATEPTEEPTVEPAVGTAAEPAEPAASTPATDVQMLAALVQLREALQQADLPLAITGVEEQRAHRTEIVEQLVDYVIPRVAVLEAPLLVVVGGSTGAGKSTLVNSLVGRRVTQPGVLRPTTRSAVLVHHPDDAAWFGPDRLLPELKRVDHTTDDHAALQLVPADSVPRGLAILDAPDVDSVEEANRTLAAQLLAAGDLWLFVTSAARYADQVPWVHLKEAAQRSTAVAVVLDRTPADAVQTVSTHLARMLASRGLKDSPLFVVHEGPVDDEGLLPADHVADVRAWLDSLAEDRDARATVVAQTLNGTIRTLTQRVHPVVEAAARQAEALDVLRAAVTATYDDAAARLLAAGHDGSLLRGELLARWQDFVGSGDLLRTLEDKVGWLRERLVNAVKGKPQQADRVSSAVEEALVGLVVERLERAAGEASDAWGESQAGRALLADHPDLRRASREVRRAAERSAREWQREVTELVRVAGADKRTTARFLAYGVHGLAVTVMVAALGGAGASAETPDPSAVAGTRLLEAVLGVTTATDLLAQARDTLRRRLAELTEVERGRWNAVLDQVAVGTDAALHLREASARVDDVRFASTTRG